MTANEIPDETPITPFETTDGPIAIYGVPWGADSLTDRLAIARMRARDFLTSASHRSVISSGRAINELRNRAVRMKNERPVALLGLIAGSAFVLGMTLRIWRSRG